MSGPVNGSPGGNRRGLLARYLDDARGVTARLNDLEADDPRAGHFRAAAVQSWGRVLRYADADDDAALLIEAQGELDALQRQAFALELARWSPILREHGFLDCELDAESLDVLARARVESLPLSARWSMHREHGGGR